MVMTLNLEKKTDMKDGKTLTNLSAHVDQEIRRKIENKGAGTLDQQLNKQNPTDTPYWD